MPHFHHQLFSDFTKPYAGLILELSSEIHEQKIFIIWHYRSQLKNVDSSGIWTRTVGTPVRRSACWAIESTGIEDEFYLIYAHEIFARQLNAIHERTCSVSILLQNHPQRWTDTVSRRCKFKSRSSQHFSVDFGSIRLSRKFSVHMLDWLEKFSRQSVTASLLKNETNRPLVFCTLNCVMTITEGDNKWIIFATVRHSAESNIAQLFF